MDIRHLQYFLEVARQKNMTKAAETLHISQPALSKMIKNLEEELGLTLIIRSNKASEVTDAGQIVMDYAQRMISLMEEMATTLSDMTNLQRGSIHIGIPPIAGSLFFPKVIAEFHATFPNIKINITEYPVPKLTKKVLDGEIDLGIAVLPIDEVEILSYPIVSEKMKLILHVDHKLSENKVVKLNELKDEEFIFISEDFALHDIIWNHCIQAGFQPRILFKSTQWDFMTEMVAAHLGLTILPESLCYKIDNELIKILDLEPVIPWNLSVITKKNKYISNAAQTFIDFMIKEQK
ncbi:LysR family transcriptional regulator [Niallia sp. XMNu-256]|uniref:LysR family transcriptional regulator n=1 Tax=Niallia sp. XMNu-256 TaxID=3082444 RepID=UPI0030D22E8B